jgi:prepilin-type N-terminal cleavage/methylation domain-containing protein
MHSIPPRLRRFTLLELMAVMAIIAILFSLLFPSVMRARHVANSAVCLSKLKQLDMTARAYAMSNRSTLPVFAWGNSDFARNLWDVPAAFCRAIAGDNGKIGDLMCSYNFSYNNGSIVRKSSGTVLGFNNGVNPELSGVGKRYLVGFNYWAISFSNNPGGEIGTDNTGHNQNPQMGKLVTTKALWSDNARGNGNTLSAGWNSNASLHVFKGATNCGVILGDSSGSLKREEALIYRRNSASTWYNWY